MPRPRLPLDMPKLAALYASGLSTNDIARMVGCSPDTVHRRLLGAGVTMRPPGKRGTVPTPAAGQSARDVLRAIDVAWFAANPGQWRSVARCATRDHARAVTELIRFGTPPFDVGRYRVRFHRHPAAAAPAFYVQVLMPVGRS